MQKKYQVSRFAEKLMQRGYHFLKIKPEEIGVFYTEIAGTIKIVLNIDYHDKFYLDASLLSNIKAQIERIFLESKGKIADINPNEDCEIKMFSVVWGNYRSDIRSLLTTDKACWFADLSENKLVRFEFQESDFYGLHGIVEEALAEARSGYLIKSREIAAFPILNVIIIGVNILAYIVLEYLGDTLDAEFMMEHGALYPTLVLMHQQWYRVVTSMFMHFGITHLVGNMFLLYFLGEAMEAELGKGKYISVYFVSGIGGSLLSIFSMVWKDEYAVAAGASGAVYGVIGAMLYVAIRNKGRLWNFTKQRMLLLIGVGIYFCITAKGISNYAHLGGLVTGIIMAVLLYHKKPGQENNPY
jgi:rhomboid protease GluP